MRCCLKPTNIGCGGLLLAVLVHRSEFAAGAEPGSDAARRAIAFLVEEVPAWPEQNECFSCHNNGDGVRVLSLARQRGWDIPEESLSSSRAWLLHPERWETSGGNPDYGDRQLINVQFSAALSVLSQDDRGPGRAEQNEQARAALRRVAPTIVELQSPDGSWAFEAEGTIGSPIGYGRPLMTVVAQAVLLRAGDEEFAPSIERAAGWLRQIEPKNVLDSAAVLWGLAQAEDAPAQASVARRLETIRQGQSRRGGWGSYVTAPPEPFDTAIVLLGLSRLPPTEETENMIAVGREYLFSTQLSSGGWPATTRPAGHESYPQMISTSAWATLALVMTEPPVVE